MALSFDLSRVLPFTVAAVEDAVKKYAPGVFILDPPDSRTGTTSAKSFVGRADADLATTLQRHVKTGYKVFQFSYAASPADAFKKESELWHTFKPGTNPVHPPKPKGNDAPCIYCGK